MRSRSTGSGIGFHALAHPVAPLRVGHVHEFRADGSAVDAPRLVGHRAAQVQVRMLFDGKVSERVELRLHVAPAAESIENLLSFSLVRLRSGDLSRWHYGGLQ